MATPIITEKELRIWSMDRPELNTLIDGVKFSSEDIEQAQIFVVDYFNLMPPPTGYQYTVETFPSRTLMLLGVWAHLLKGAAIGDAINEFDYAAEGVQINDRNKAQLYALLGRQYWDEFKDMAANIKLTQNIAQAYGTKFSEYRFRSFSF